MIDYLVGDGVVAFRNNLSMPFDRYKALSDEIFFENGGVRR